MRPCSLECATSHSDGPDAPPCAAKCQLSGLATTLLTLSLRLPFFGATWCGHSEYYSLGELLRAVALLSMATLTMAILRRYYAQWLTMSVLTTARYYAQWLFVGACIVCAISMASRRQQGASFTPLRGGDVDGIDNVDPEAPFSSALSAERTGSRPTERTPVLGNGPREPRRSGGKKPSSSSHKAGRAERHSGEAHRGERASGDAAQGQGQGAGQGAGQEQWWAQSS